MLSDGTIRKLVGRGRLSIEPLDEDAIQPCSVDLTLDSSFLVFDRHEHGVINPITSPSATRPVEVAQSFVLHPGEFVLASTAELVGLPNDIVGHVDGKSSLGRLGLLIHATAGFIDPGFRGQVTLELSNVAPLPIELIVGMSICQISFTYLDRGAERPYGHPSLRSKYQNQTGATASRYGQSPAS